MTITTLTLADKLNPVEIQDWFNANPDIVLDRILIQDTIVYILWK